MAIPERLTEPMANQLADALAALHAADPAGFPELPREHDDAWVALRAAVEPACRALLSPVEVGTIAAWWERFLAAPERRRYRPAICHGDLWHENLLLDAGENRLCGILDWENFTVGDPAQDLAYLRHAGDAFADAVFARYVERAGARADDALARRIQWFWEAREFDGLRLAIDLRDEEEMMDTVGKLRRGPILAPPGQATTS